MTPTPPTSGDTPVTPFDHRSEGLDRLTTALANLRNELANVDYRAAVMRLLLGADDQRHLDVAATDLATAIESFRAAGEAVITGSESAAAAWGVREPERTLAVLADRAPEKWKGDLSRHTRLLAKETRKIRERMTNDLGLVNSGERQVSALLELILGEDEPPATYDPKSSTAARLVDHLA